ncbi:hypothetical protein ABEB36_007600 [Hypothenemus hampei]|uniref:Uncharacterized protein n=1 Tax=Hypothenemus hampei TaxID=57062 RepID=A0ABD1EUJ3_HYPHA
MGVLCNSPIHEKFQALVMTLLHFKTYVPNVSDKIRDFCIDNTGVTHEIVEALLANPDKEMINEESCYVHCVLIETGFLAENGEINIKQFEHLKGNKFSDIDLNCLKSIQVLEHCNETMLLRTCNA